jgi:hypothetical protein
VTDEDQAQPTLLQLELGTSALENIFVIAGLVAVVVAA